MWMHFFIALNPIDHRFFGFRKITQVLKDNDQLPYLIYKIK